MKPEYYLLIGLLVGIIFTYSLIQINKNCIIESDSKKLLDEKINILVRQTARWSTAATQDEAPLIAVLHANYGVGYLGALKNIATDEQIYSATGIDIKKFEKAVVDAQDYATVNAVKTCPQYGPQPTYLTGLSGEGITQ